MTIKADSQPSRGCGDQINPPPLPQYYCEYVKIGGEWCLVNANTPSNYYCTRPSGQWGTGHLYLEPCPVPTIVSDRDCSCQVRQACCYGTYLFQCGIFYPLDAASTGGAGCPLDLVKHSLDNPLFSFLVPVEVQSPTYFRGVYEFSGGRFTLVDESPAQGACPPDLHAYSVANETLRLLVALKFTNEGHV